MKATPTLIELRRGSDATTSLPRVLLLRYDRIGDVVVSIPVFRALHRTYPTARFDVLLGRRNSMMSRCISAYTSSTHVYTKSVKETIRLVRTLRREKYDVVVDMMDNTSRTSAMLLRLLRPNVSVGFDNENRGLYTHVVPGLQNTNVHIVDLMARLLQPFGIDPLAEDLHLEFPLFSADYSSVTAPSEIPKTIDVFVNLSSGDPARQWNMQSYRRVIEQIRQRNPRLRLAIGAAAVDEQAARELALVTGVHLVEFVPDMYQYARYVAGSKLLLTTDTSIVHVASALQVPSVVLYNKPREFQSGWFPYKVEYRAHVSSLLYGMPDIPPDEVAESVLTLAERYCSAG